MLETHVPYDRSVLERDVTWVRIIDEFVWTLRRDGFRIAPTQVTDAVKAAACVGIDDAYAMRLAFASVFGVTEARRGAFDECFQAFFCPHRRPSLAFLVDALRIDTEERWLIDEYFRVEGLDVSGATSSVDASIARFVDDRIALQHVGAVTHRLAEQLGLRPAHAHLERLGVLLAGAVGDARAREIVGGLGQWLVVELSRVRTLVEARAFENERMKNSPTPPFEPPVRGGSLEAAALRLKFRVRVLQSARNGRCLDARKTVRMAMRSMTVPIRIANRKRRKEPPRIVLLCDVSPSMAAMSNLVVELVSLIEQLFAHVQVWLFAADAIRLHKSKASRINLTEAIATHASTLLLANTNHARAFHSFEKRLRGTKKPTVMIVGDGRTNQSPAGVSELERLAMRARSVYWLCPESPVAWTGDSAMAQYERCVRRVFVTRTVAEIEHACMAIITDRR